MMKKNNNIKADKVEINKEVIKDVHMTNLSAEIAEVAIQGPEAEQILQKLTDYDLARIKSFHFQEDVKIAELILYLSRELVIPERMALRSIQLTPILKLSGKLFWILQGNR